MRKPKYSIPCPVCGSVFHPRPSDIAYGKGNYCSRTCADLGRREPLVDRFWRQVTKTETCWLWTGKTTRFGYGKLYTFGPPRKDLVAHRVAWEFLRGPIPADKWVLHKCDVAACVNPAHLYLGTPQDNMDDKMERARQVFPGPRKPTRGEAHHHSRLTEDQVREIRARYAAGGVTQTALGIEYGVPQGTISGVVLYKSWKHIT